MQTGLITGSCQSPRQTAQFADAPYDLLSFGHPSRTLHRRFRRKSMSALSALEPRSRLAHISDSMTAFVSHPVSVGGSLRGFMDSAIHNSCPPPRARSLKKPPPPTTPKPVAPSPASSTPKSPWTPNWKRKLASAEAPHSHLSLTSAIAQARTRIDANCFSSTLLKTSVLVVRLLVHGRQPSVDP